LKIAVLSDIHENFHNLILALKECEKQEVEQILCLGDLMNAGIAKVLAIQKIPSHMIWGNNDGEKVDIMRTANAEGSNLSVGLTTYDFIVLDGKKIFMTHFDDLAEPMALSGLYDAVFYGHNHLLRREKVNDVHLVNPGEICAQKTGVSSFAIYDTVEDKIEIVKMENSISLKSHLVDQYLEENMDKLNFRSKESFINV